MTQKNENWKANQVNNNLEEGYNILSNNTNDIIKKLNMRSREELVAFLKSMWSETPKPCPLCGGELDNLHKKAKKSNSDWICIECKTHFDAIKILKELD